MAKHCRRCDVVKPDEAFAKNVGRKDGLQVYCRDCMSSYESKSPASKRWYDKHIEEQRAKARERYWANRDRKIEYMRTYQAANKTALALKIKLRQQADKMKALAAYGSKCSCCGESEPAFLTIDHLNNGRGNPANRKIEGWGSAFYRWLKRADFPPDFQVLCFNCNCGRSVNGGVCPHRSTVLSS